MTRRSTDRTAVPSRSILDQVSAEKPELRQTIALSSQEPTLAELAKRAGVDATTLSRNVKSLEQRKLVRSLGALGRAGKRLVLTDEGRRLMDASIVVWDRAKIRLTDILGEESSHAARDVMSRLTRAAQTAASESSG